MNPLLQEIRACTHCAADLPLPPKPILDFAPSARILIAGQAPGRRAHDRGIPWDDASGDRLREWLGVDKAAFYDPTVFAIVPMGFCYPGTGRSGDLPPRPECAPLWAAKIARVLRRIEFKVIIGAYAQEHHLAAQGATLTDTVKAWRDHLPAAIPLPHPSPRNNIWLKKNPWFEKELVPVLRRRVARLRA